MTKIKVGIVDDELLFIKGMQLILELDKEICITYTAGNGAELVQSIKNGSLDVDVLLLDISMPVLDGVDTLLLMNEMELPIKVIILTSYYNDGMIIKLLDEGASGFLAKNEAPDRVIHTIKEVMARGFYINDYILQLIRNRRLVSKKKTVSSELTSRETEVLKLICQEYTNKEIADKLFISSRTVEGHRKSILEKTDCKNTAGMVIYAIEHKLIDVKISKYN